MSISVACASCGQGLKAPDRAAGKNAMCPKCGHSISIPVVAPQGKQGVSFPEQPPEANPDELAAAFFLEGDVTPACPQRDAALAEEAEGGGVEVPLPWEPGFKDVAQKADGGSGKGPNRLTAWAVGGVAAVALLTGACLAYRSHVAAEPNPQIQDDAENESAGEERTREEQLAHQQQLEQTALEEKRRREDAEAELAQVSREQKQQAEQERARKEQLSREEDERKKREKDMEAAAQRAVEAQARLNSDLEKLAGLDAEKKARERLAEWFITASPANLIGFRRGLTVAFECVRGRDLKSYSLEDRRLCIDTLNLIGDVPLPDATKRDKTVDELVRLVMGPCYPEN